MQNGNMMSEAQNIINSIGQGNKSVKRIKKQDGLLVREEQLEKIILAEDNRQLMFG